MKFEFVVLSCFVGACGVAPHEKTAISDEIDHPKSHPTVTLPQSNPVADTTQRETQLLARAQNLRLPYVDKIHEIPDYLQTDPAYGGFPDQGKKHCGPAAVSNSLIWLDDHGFDEIVPNSGDRKRDQHDLIFTLGSEAYMYTPTFDGTPALSLCHGLHQFLVDRGYPKHTIKYQGWGPVAPVYNTGKTAVHLDWLKSGVFDSGSAWLSVGWYHYNADTDTYQRQGGHWLTLVGFGFDGKKAHPDYLVVHDPGSRSGPTFANAYLLTVPLTTGTLVHDEGLGQRPAQGFYRVERLLDPSDSRVPIIETAVMLQLKK